MERIIAQPKRHATDVAGLIDPSHPAAPRHQRSFKRNFRAGSHAVSFLNDSSARARRRWLR